MLTKAATGFVAALWATSAAAKVNPYTGEDVIPRPDVRAAPYSAGKPFPESPVRDEDKYCFVKPAGSSSKSKKCVPRDGHGDNDDAPAILKAFHDCNNGGTVVLYGNYTVASPLDLTFLEEIDVVLTGTINFATDIYYWTERTFKFDFQHMSSMWLWGGRDVNIYGGGQGLINGNGVEWWHEMNSNDTLLRPVLFATDGIHGGFMSGISMFNPPNWFNFIANTTDFIIDDMSFDIHTDDMDYAEPHNTDGWDTYRSDNIVVQNSVINNWDDCFAFKPNSTNVVVQNLQCNGSHGISVGSLGQYVDQFDIVENAYVYNISMSNASDGARIKVWPGTSTPFQPLLSGGGGSGYVRNVTYDGMTNDNNDWAIELTQCYGQKNQTICNQYPSNLTIEDITFKNMVGTTSDKHDPKVGTLICSSPDVCKNIRVENIDVKPPSGKKPQWVCINMDKSLLDVDCIENDDDDE